MNRWRDGRFKPEVRWEGQRERHEMAREEGGGGRAALASPCQGVQFSSRCAMKLQVTLV